MGGRGEDIADEALAALVCRVRFAGEQDLESADLLGDRGQARWIVEREGSLACRLRRDVQSRE